LGKEKVAKEKGKIKGKKKSKRAETSIIKKTKDEKEKKRL